MTIEATIRIMRPLPQISLRADPADAALLARVGAALGALPPTAPNTVAASADGLAHVLWLGPDEWLVVGRESAAAGVAAATESAVRAAGAGGYLTAVDVSANRVGIEVSGPGAAELLAHGCALDLERGLPAGACAQTLAGARERRPLARHGPAGTRVPAPRPALVPALPCGVASRRTRSVTQKGRT